MTSASYGLKPRSAVRSRRMRRIRTAVVIALLAVVWLGYWVAHEIAAESSRGAAQQAVASEEIASPSAGYYPNPSPTRDSASEPLTPEASVVPAEAQVVPDAPPPQDVSAGTLAVVTPQSSLLPSPPENVRSNQAPLSLFGSPSGAGGHRMQSRSFGGGGISSGSGGGGGFARPTQGGSDETTGSGNGVPSVLGHRLASDSVEPTGETASNGDGSSNGNGNSNNANSSGNGKSNGNGGSNANANANGGGTGAPALNADSKGNGNSNANNGSNGSSNGQSNAQGQNDKGGKDTGGDQGGNPGGRSGIARFAPDAIDEPNADPRDVPEPGSILVAVGLAAAYARRRAG